MQNFIIDFMNNFGYFAIFLLIVLEVVFPPIPSEIILSFGGFMTTSSSLSILGVVIISTIASVLGAIILYYVGRIFNKDRLISFTKTKLGKFIRLKEKDILLADNWFNKKGSLTVLFGRCVPILRSLISIPAGMSEMPLPKFIIYTSLGSLIWNSILVNLGAIAGDNWEQIVEDFDKYSSISLILLIVLILIILVFYIKTRKKNPKVK